MEDIVVQPNSGYNLKVFADDCMWSMKRERLRIAPECVGCSFERREGSLEANH